MSSSPFYTVVDQFDEDELPDIPSAPAALLKALQAVPDPRKPRGRRHGLSTILAVAACAVIAGARSFIAIAEWVNEATPATLTRLGLTGEKPSESTIRRTLNKINADGLDVIVGTWAALVTHSSTQIQVIAVDGKSVRGSAPTGGRCRHLLSALTHTEGLVLGQIDVDIKTNEIPMFSKLLDNIELFGALVTADAMHCQKIHATYLVEQRGAHYLLTVKGNQPTLRRQLAQLPWTQVNITDTRNHRGHGRVEKRTLKVVSIDAGWMNRTGFAGGSSSWEGWGHGRSSGSYPKELRERAVRMFEEIRPDHASEWAAMESVASKLGIGSTQTIHNWVRRAEVDAGARPGTPSLESAELRKLRTENRELRRANEILKAASAFFAAELCATRRWVDREVVRDRLHRAVAAAW